MNTSICALTALLGISISCAAPVSESLPALPRRSNGIYSLHEAAAGAADCVQYLLSHGGDAARPNAAGQSADQLSSAPETTRQLQRARQKRQKEIELCQALAKGNTKALETAMKQPRFNPDILDGDNQRRHLPRQTRHHPHAGLHPHPHQHPQPPLHRTSRQMGQRRRL